MRRRLVFLCLALFATSCLFRPSTAPIDGDAAASDAGADDASDAANVDPGDGGSDPDDGGSNPDDGGSNPDDGGDSGTVTPDSGVPSTIGPSTICGPSVAPSVSGGVPPRIRAHATATGIVAVATAPGNGFSAVQQSWDTWSSDGPHWVSPGSFSGLPDGFAGGDVTGVDLNRYDGSPIAVVTRRDANACAGVWSTFGFTAINCGRGATTYGAALTNLAGLPRYFWFGGSGVISSIPVDDVAMGGGQIAVPWCVDNGSGCVANDFVAVDARGNGGSHVLLSDSDGRAYGWDTTQTVEDPSADEDCNEALQPPIPLRFQGNALKYSHIDLVWFDGGYHLVVLTQNSVDLYEVNLDLMIGQRLGRTSLEGDLLLDAATDGSRVVAAVRTASDTVTIVGFGAGDGLQTGRLPGTTIRAAGVAIEGGNVGVVAITGDGLKANAWPL